MKIWEDKVLGTQSNHLDFGGDVDMNSDPEIYITTCHYFVGQKLHAVLFISCLIFGRP